MDEDENNDVIDPFQCRLILKTPKGKRKLLMKIISPLTGWIDPSFRLINIREKEICSGKCDNEQREKSTDLDYLRIPSLSVMSFLTERGNECATDVQKHFLKRPWKFHHKVELYSRRSPEHAAACQEFYGIADDMPLWSVCPIHYGNEHFRFLIYVRNFQKMVEFYRVITDVEMESNKPGFCIFQLYTQQGLDIQLALKYSKHIEPHPVTNASLVFKVKNIDVIQSSLGCDIQKINEETYSTQDPDGNILHLCERAKPCKDKKEGTMHQYVKESLSEDLKSYRSSSDSHDSGRCSDSENWSSEPETIKGDSISDMNTKANVIYSSKLSHIKDETPERLGYKSIASEQGHCDKLARQNDFNITEVTVSNKRKVEPVYL